MGVLDAELNAQLSSMAAELMRRAGCAETQERYYEGDLTIPAAITKSRLTKAYKMLMPMSTAPWGSVVVDSVQDRLEVAGLRDVDQKAADTCWGIWQDNQMDSESKLAHTTALITGRAFATVWPDEDGNPEIVFDGPDQMIVKYAAGRRRRREAGMRFWIDDEIGDPMATLYRPDGLYKFKASKESARQSVAPAKIVWERREVDGEAWPLPNPWNVVPNIELAVNRRLKSGPYGYARGEYEHVTGLIDRINLLTFLGLVVAFWMGFPLRGVIGDKILRDDDGKALPPFEVGADSIVQLENAEAKFAEFKAADRSNLSIFDELAQFAYLTKTPAYHFPMANGISNVSAETILALNGAANAKVSGHQGFVGEGHEETLRVGGLMLPEPALLSPRATLVWKDSEQRSLAERADAATKLKDVLPWQAVAELALNAGTDEINRWAAMRGSDAFSKLLDAAVNPEPTPAA